MMTFTRLQSHDRWYEIADFDAITRTVIRVYRPEVEAHAVATTGNFGTLGNQILIVRAQTSGIITIGFERDLEVPLSEARIGWERLGETQSNFLISYEDYRRGVQYDFGELPPEGDAAELEDYDFGLWALNIKNSSERQGILLGRWQSERR